MEKFRKSEYFPLTLLALGFVLFIPFFWLHQGILTIDTGRELYIPSRMLSGELLYKDILNIYGALAYQINALLFALFGERIETLYGFGLLNSFLIVTTVFFISREFFDKTVSFFFAILTIAVPVFTSYLFNTNFPYSYSFVYSLSSFLLSVLFLIEFEKTKDIKFSCLSSLFIGFSIASKLEFSLFFLVVAYILFKNKTTIKQTLLNLFCFLAFPVISYGSLMLQGVQMSDFINTLGLIKHLSESESFKIFYQYGLTPMSFILRLVSAVMLSVGAVILLIRNKIKTEKTWLNHLLNIVFVLILSGFFLLTWKIVFSAIPVLILILTLIFFGKKDTKQLILLLGIIAGCFKTMFYVDIEHFGAFLLPLLLLGLSMFAQNQKRLIIITLSALFLVFVFDDCYWLREKNFLVSTNKGNFYTFQKEGKTIKKLMEFAQNNLTKEDKLLILPEGAFVNFALSQPSKSQLYSLIPLYVGMLGEENIIEELKRDLPKYIVITSLDTIEFGANNFCGDYAKEVCGYLSENYSFNSSIDETSYKMNIYERNE
ncbi:glycosyltransferase family 39 protein [bacterium]|nr:glycosyltransferase family 39 protein [bacterium]